MVTCYRCMERLPLSPSNPEALPLGVRQTHARKRNRKRRDGCDPA
jgi:hypothetical protein